MFRTTKNHVFGSVTASINPCFNDPVPEAPVTRSAIILASANLLISSLSTHLALPFFDPGKSGKVQKAAIPHTVDMSDSMMNSHCQPYNPDAPDRPEKIPDARIPENAWANTSPE